MINCPVDQVFAFITNFEEAAKAAGGLDEIKQTSEGPPGLGSTFSLKRRFVSKPRESELCISEWEPNKKVVLVGKVGPIKQLKRTFLFESIDGKTRLTMVAEAELHGLWKLLQPIIVWIGNMEGKKANAKLKQVLEAQTR